MIEHVDARLFFIFQMERLRAAGFLYAWGGESFDEGGYDCSGAVCAALMATRRVTAWRKLYRAGRTTAAGLDAYYDGLGCPTVRDPRELLPGMLTFFSSPGGSLYHVGVHVMTIPPIELDGGRVADVGPVGLESGGSGSKATTPRQALVDSAGVRLTASDTHGNGRFHARDPFRVL